MWHGYLFLITQDYYKVSHFQQVIHLGGMWSLFWGDSRQIPIGLNPQLSLEGGTVNTEPIYINRPTNIWRTWRIFSHMNRL